jgi:tRNA U34 5-methylaminomethyl-2-thiouridine-forming methyltransferase MnmC
VKPVDTNDGSRTLFSERYAQTFHSQYGAVRESRHVFLGASGVAERLANAQPTQVLEVGFGTGLNALLSADLAKAHGAALQFVSLEQDLLPAETLRALNHHQLLSTPALAQRLYDAIARHQPPQTTLRCELDAQIVVEIRIGDARDAKLADAHFDAVYLDAFSPEQNPELWQQDFFRLLWQALKPGGRLATYSAKGVVRRGLTAVGFKVEKRPGPPGKREMLLAARPD